MNAYLELTKAGSRDDSSLLFGDVKTRGENKRNLMEQVISRYRNQWNNNNNREWYGHRFNEYYRDLPTGVTIRELFLHPASPLLIGNGTLSALESHITLHRIYGVPYIPGTAIKGVASHYCHLMIGKACPEFQIDKEYYNVLFGNQEQRGFIQFYDALCEPDFVAESFVLDVMTPHHQDYNQINLKDGKADETVAPRDDDSPNPIPFLSVRANFKLMLTCEGTDQASEEWLEVAVKIVKEALTQWGVGGKTNAGYGRFIIQ